MFFYSTPRKTQGRWGQCAVRRKQPAVETMTNGTHEELTFSSKPQPYPTCLSSKGLIFLSIHRSTASATGAIAIFSHATTEASPYP